MEVAIRVCLSLAMVSACSASGGDAASEAEDAAGSDDINVAATDVPQDTGPQDTGPQDTGAADASQPDIAQDTEDVVTPDVPDVGGECDEDEDCDNANPCDGEERCVAFACVPGTPLQCDDVDPCTDNVCDQAAGGCVFPANTVCDCVSDADCDDEDPCTGSESCVGFACIAGSPVLCDDGNPCNGLEACVAGQCEIESGSLVVCTDGDACTDDSCDPSTGDCVFVDNAACECQSDSECTDPTPCDGGKRCQNHVCVDDVASAITCADADPCTADTCEDPTGTCVFSPVDGCDCAADEDCNDTDLCNGEEVCEVGQCVTLPGSPVVCDDEDPCSFDGCNPITGGCFFVDAGACECQSAAACDDADPCTVDSCVEYHCQHVPSDCECASDIDCDDNNACNGEEACAANVCFGGTAIACADQDPCTDDVCEPTSGQCHFLPNDVCECTIDADCDDANDCNGVDSCVASVCVASAPILCDDESACTDDFCDLTTGDCVFELNEECECLADWECDDNDACTGTESCVVNECLSNAPVVCDDGDPCTESICDEIDGACSAFDTGLCECQASAECDDGDPCNGLEACVLHGCVLGTPITCDDNDICTEDFCDPATGVCSWTNSGQCECIDSNDCFDLDPCDGGVSCVDNVCVPDQTTAIDCDDSDPCTQDVCLVGVGTCEYSETECGCTLDADCDDEDPCNGLEVCEFAECIVAPFSVPECNDADPCTFDECTSVGDIASCENGDAGICECILDADCDDGLPCNGAETCVSNGCVTGAAVTCSDDSPCTNDICNANTGECYYLPNDVCGCEEDADCDDGSPCTGVERCESFSCVSGNDVQCDDGSPCTDDFCDLADGQCFSLSNSLCECTSNSECNDGDICNGTEACVGFGCVPGTLIVCDDSSPCTSDVCDVLTGDCHFFENGLCECTSNSECDDLNLCNGTESCVGFACLGGTPPVCDDGQACTLDFCNVAQQVCATMPADCSDSDTCTDDSCNPATGLCVNTPSGCDDDDPCTDNLCDTAWGGCAWVDNGLCECESNTDCDDGDACSGVESCATHQCVAGQQTNCDDNDPCTDDSCNAETGVCAHADTGLCECQQNTDCDDGDDCNGTDSCVAFTCTSSPPVDCDDNDVCTTDNCSAGNCSHDKLLGCGTPTPFCEVSGATGDFITCKLQVVGATATEPTTAALQARLVYDAAQISLYGLTCDVAGNDPCWQLDQTHSGHALVTNPGWGQWTGDVDLLIYHPTTPAAALSQAWISSNTVQGNPDVVDFYFRPLANISPNDAVTVTLTDLVASDPDGAVLSASHDGPLVITEAP